MKIVSLLPIVLLLAGCDSMVQMNAANNATKLQIASLQSQADTTAAWIQGQTTLGVAQSQAMTNVATTVAWSSQLPWVVLAVCATVIVVAIIYWRGRVAVGATGSVYPPTHSLPTAAPPARVLPQERAALQDFARAQGGQLVETPDGRILLQVDGRRRQLRITAK